MAQLTDTDDLRQHARNGVAVLFWFLLILFLVLLLGFAFLVYLKLFSFLPGDNPRLRNANDIRQLEGALANARTYFKMHNEEFPSKLMLCKSYAEYVANRGKPHYVYSLALLQRIFPLLWRTPPTQASPAYDQNWDNNGMKGGPIILEGDQCLVFFLGGIPSAPDKSPTCLGFSAIGRKPADTSSLSRIGPFYDFEPDRLVSLHPDNRFFSYLDAHRKQPYAYFSSNNTRNGYNKWFRPRKNPASDCSRLGVWPYAQALGRTPDYLNPSGFQIISAGADGKFGPGTDFTRESPFTWTPATADRTPANGKDDQNNFFRRLLGTPE
jgi:hypothetical protein